MSKFIEITDEYQDREKRVLNVDYIREIREIKQHHMAKTWLKFREEEVYCLESYEDIKAMLMYDPAVADIVMKGNEQ